MQTSFAIGCLVQWYEIEMLPEYIDTLLAAVDMYDRDRVRIDLKLVTNQELEQLDNPDRLTYILSQFDKQVERLEEYRSDVFIDKGLTTIADYRREFNAKYCELADVLVWGESDMLVPQQAFISLNHLHQNVKNTPKYIATFAICKMWDDSWKPLEHPEFTDKPFIEGDTENWWNIPYTMTKEEMNTFNNVEELQLSVINPHKFNGCGLVISSEVIRAGVNIPASVFFIHEDTAFMYMVHKVLGNIPQYHFRNLLVVHNRKNPNKRNYIKGEESYTGVDIDNKRKSHDWYSVANTLCRDNCNNLFNPGYKSYKWKDVWQKIKE